MTYDVIIAGAGPVGLFLACELRLAGLSVLVLERADKPASPLKSAPFGVRGLSAPTTDAFYRRGLLEAVALPQQATAPGRRQGGHFAGIPIPLDQVETSGWASRLSTPAAPTLSTTMERVETALAQRAADLRVEVRRGLEVVDIESGEEGVEVRAGAQRFQAQWLVGCDGGRSVVRKLAGFDVVGTEPEFTGYSVQVDLADPKALPLGRNHTRTGMYFQTEPGVISMVEFDGGTHHRTQPLTRDHVQAVLRRVSGVDVTVNALHVAATWTDRARQVFDYRKGRVLLAGDAAHIHSPLGGQGLNLGLGDAMNLGWKLAATVKREAPTGLLDTYTEERRPEGARVLDWSRAQVALMRPSPSSRALASMMRDLIGTRDGATYFAQRLWGTTLRYDLGDSHPLVGRSAPNFALADGSTLGECLRPGKGLLLDFDGATPLRSTADRWRERISYVACASEDRLGIVAALVRPDGVLAWAAARTSDLVEVAEAAERWFGLPLQKI